MKALILSHGTRGDVQPFAALAHALQEAGHESVLGAPEGMASLAQPYGFRFFPLDDGPNRFMDDQVARDGMENNFRGLRGKIDALKMISKAKPLIAQILKDMARAAEDGADVVIHPPNMPIEMVAEKLGVPSVAAAMQPGWVPTGAFPSPLVPVRLPRPLNRLSYLPPRLLLRSFNGVARTWRRETLGLSGKAGPDPVVTIQAFSPRMLPGIPDDYPATVHTTGFWFLPAPAEWGPSPQLIDFLEAGEPPVYIGFGSMIGGDPRRAGTTVAEAVRRSGVRAILMKGWGGLDADDLPDNVLLLDQAPHDWLFPRMSAVVHHGGSGTTGTALAAGRPQVICPFVADQPFYARAVHGLGASPRPQRQRDLTADGLASAITQAVTDRAMAARAAEIGEEIRAERGVSTAVGLIEKLAVN